MRDIEYSPLVKEKMLQLKERILLEHGEETAKRLLAGIMKDAERLQQFAESGIQVSKMYDIQTDYRYLFTHRHYLVYRIEQTKIIIVQMFHEREDFMMQLFGASGRSQESIEYWGD